MRSLLVICAFATCLLMTSCATLFTKQSYPIVVNSEPNNANITVVNKKGEQVFLGKTPATVTLDASSKYMSGERFTITISKKGYEDQQIYLNAKIEGWYWGNLLLGGLIGMLVVDPLTGAMYKLDTTPINVVLSEDESTALHIVDINTLSEEQKKSLVKLD